MAKCDLCGDSCGAGELSELLSQYRVSGVKDLCPKCRDWADKQKSILVSNIAPQLRGLICDRIGVKPRKWWQFWK